MVRQGAELLLLVSMLFRPAIPKSFLILKEFYAAVVFRRTDCLHLVWILEKQKWDFLFWFLGFVLENQKLN